MTIDFSHLHFSFTQKPLLVGGKAMEYYGLRKSGKDIDLVVTKNDLVKLAKKYPSHIKNLAGDLGIAVHGFEIWKTITYFDYDFLSENAIDESNYQVISLEKLLLQKAMAMLIPKYHEDLKLIVKKIKDTQILEFDRIKKENEQIVSNIQA